MPLRLRGECSQRDGLGGRGRAVDAIKDIPYLSSINNDFHIFFSGKFMISFSYTEISYPTGLVLA